MVAIDRERDEAREQPMLGESLLPIAAVYGPNASGKSNLIAAFAWLRDAVQLSLRVWEDTIPIEPFAFGSGADEPSIFEIEFTIDGVRFEYVLELDATSVRYEGLFHYPEKKRRRIFERESGQIRFQRGLGSLAGTRDLLTERTLALSIARRFEEPLINGFSQAINRIQVIGLPSRRRAFGTTVFRSGFTPQLSTRQWFDKSTQPLFDGGREQALALLRLADLGIHDVVVDTEEISYPETGEVSSRRRVRLSHNTAEGPEPLEFDAESAGTRTWFNFIGPVLAALHYGSLLLVDELDARLHPTLSAQLISLFHQPATNPRGAQLVFASHDTSLLNHLNRDEVWLTEKRQDGSTRLGALAEFAGERVRKSQNLEGGYLHGRFGALPHVDQTSLLRALGLIG